MDVMDGHQNRHNGITCFRNRVASMELKQLSDVISPTKQRLTMSAFKPFKILHALYLVYIGFLFPYLACGRSPNVNLHVGYLAFLTF